MIPQERLIATAKNEVGYIGKRSNDQLDSPAGNGGGKFTKFARDLDALGNFYNGPKQGFDWCDVFVDWCFVRTFGRETAQRLTCQPDRSAGAGTGYSLGYYKAKGRLYSTPQVGDQIFFGDNRSTWHTGIVTAVSGGTVCTVEGNAGTPLGVHQFRYALGSRGIKGYGRPDWGLAGGAVPPAGDIAGSTPAARPSAPGTTQPKAGDVVDFTGTRHYPASSSAKGFPCKPGKARVTALARGAAHPCHLVRITGGGSTVYGWVDQADVK